MSRFLYIALAVLVIVSICPTAHAQTSTAGGALEGWAYDTQNSPIAGAQIEARSQEAGLTKSATTNDHGYYRIDLPVGLYTIGVSQPGFTAFQRKDVAVSLSLTVRIDAHLEVAGQAQQITVNEPPLPIDPTQTSMTNSVGHERIEESPVRTRNALDFVLMEPNVVASNISGSQPSGAASSGLSSSGFSFGGMRPTSNRIAIDGVENDDEFSGGSRTELSPEIVQEFQVINNGISAASGGASGGAVNIVTRSGVNKMHGDAFLFIQNGALNARPPIEEAPSAPDLNRYRIGLANGGDIERNKTFYYAAIEQEREQSQVAADIEPEVAADINRALSSELYPAFSLRSLGVGFAPTTRAETEASGKIDRLWNERSFTSLRYALTNNREAGDAYNNDGLVDGSGHGSSFLRDQSLTGSWTFTASPTAVNEIRAQFSQRNAVLRTNEAAGPEMIIDGLADFGQPYQGNLRYREEHADAADTYSWSRGGHLVQLGGAVQYVHEDTVNRFGQGGLFLFSTLADFLAAQPAMYRQVFSAPAATFAMASYGGFLQDHWVISPRFTVDAGLRYDFVNLPYGIHRDVRDFSPRLGMAFSPARRWVFRAGYGVFFDRYLLSSFDQSVVGGLQGFEQIVEGAPAAAVLRTTAGGSRMAPLPGIAPSVYRIDPALATPYSQQASAGLHYAPAKDITASADYLFVRGLRLPRTREVNLLPPIQEGPQPLFSTGRIDPSLDGIFQLEDSATSIYNGMSVALRVIKEDFTLDTSYTLSKATDDASSWAEQPQNPYAVSRDRGPSLFDVRNRFVLSGLFDVPIGDEDGAGKRAPRNFWVKVFGNIELAPILTVESARPANPLTGVDSFGTLSYPLSARPEGFARNSLKVPPLASLELRILKAIPMGEGRHLDLVAESFNLLNHTNVTAIDPFFGIESTNATWFQRPIAALPGRQLQFSIDFEF